MGIRAISFRLLLLTLVAANTLAQQHFSRCANDTEIIDHLLFDKALTYNKHKLPAAPVNVRIEMWVQEVTSVSEMTQDFEIGESIMFSVRLSCRSAQQTYRNIF